MSLAHEQLLYAVYFAPRGKSRILNLGHLISQRHISATDRLIGLIGDAGAGKSLLIRGMFPGLELTNDDEGLNIRPLPIFRDTDRAFFSSHTYHIDARFELAFSQINDLADAVKRAVQQDKRVIIEHFDLLYPVLGMNAEVLIGIGEEVIVTRPNVFGPLPKDISDIVFKSIKYRKMAHTAEDLTCKVLSEEFGFSHHQVHSDVRHGFVLEFTEKPNIDIEVVENRVKEYIKKGLAVGYMDEKHIHIGDSDNFHCTGPRIHVRNTGEIENFQLFKEFKYDLISGVYALVGLVGSERAIDIDDLNKLSL
ncbi:MAG: lantibiotic transporter [Eubacterium sp.]|jgi:hypothetical protein|nr:lantibiotic transporter [Eubacterium sp.]